MPENVKQEMLALFSNLTEADFDECKSDFDELDADKSGEVSFNEVKEYLAKDGGISEHECEEYMKQYDLDAAAHDGASMGDDELVMEQSSIAELEMEDAFEIGGGGDGVDAEQMARMQEQNDKMAAEVARLKKVCSLMKCA